MIVFMSWSVKMIIISMEGSGTMMSRKMKMMMDSSHTDQGLSLEIQSAAQNRQKKEKETSVFGDESQV